MILFIISLSLFIISLILFKKNKENIIINKEKEEYNKKIEKENIYLITRKQEIEDNIRTLRQGEENVIRLVDELKNTSKQSFTNYFELLEKDYEVKNEEYDKLINILNESYSKKQTELLEGIESIKQQLLEIKNTREAAIEAQIREKEVKEKNDFYCLKIAPNDLDDIQVLERVKSKLHQPRILCMLIWSTYYQKPMTTLCNNILGSIQVTGIYKITNQETNECYIGQAVDVASRWKDHAKHGLGIDTPANNKLYKAMQEYGLNNFSFELLEKCEKAQLNEKESFYIDLYSSYSYGYNSNSGIKK